MPIRFIDLYIRLRPRARGAPPETCMWRSFANVDGSNANNLSSDDSISFKLKKTCYS